MEPKKSAEQARLWRVPNLSNLELLHARYVTHSFARHTHEGFAIGIIERGALGFHYRGENIVAPAGAINLAVPDEPHTGHAATRAGWSYRMFYLDAPTLQNAASEIADRFPGIPFFRTGVVEDVHLASIIHQLHVDFEANNASTLERQSRLLWMLTQLIQRHADDRPSLRTVGRESRSVRLVRDYIESHYNGDVSLDDLAKIANLSPFHLIRVFRNQTGLPPHSYLTQVRIRHARAFLKQGWSIAPVAMETGFVDQSHLTRHFKRIVGVTPGQYSKIVQDHGRQNA
jgi:AraC-like DNA-binding protein